MFRARLILAAAATLFIAGCSPYRSSIEVIELPPTSMDSPPPQFIVAEPTKSPVHRTAFYADLTAAGIPEKGHATLELWARSVCSLRAQAVANGATTNDVDVVKKLPSDVANTGLKLTKEQAAAAWTASKRHICR